MNFELNFDGVCNPTVYFIVCESQCADGFFSEEAQRLNFCSDSRLQFAAIPLQLRKSFKRFNGLLAMKPVSRNTIIVCILIFFIVFAL